MTSAETESSSSAAFFSSFAEEDGEQESGEKEEQVVGEEVVDASAEHGLEHEVALAQEQGYRKTDCG